MNYEQLLAQIADAKVSCAKSALASPGVFPQGVDIHNAIRNLRASRLEFERAAAAWEAYINPAKGWAPDPYAGDIRALRDALAPSAPSVPVVALTEPKS